MSLISRIKKLEEKLSLKKEKIYFIGWANCTWSEAEGLTRNKDESKGAFLRRVGIVANKKWIWCK